VSAPGEVEKVLDNPDIEIVVNLTIAAAHNEVSDAIIAAHKRVWTEEPIEIPWTAPLLMVFERSGQAHSQYKTDPPPMRQDIAEVSGTEGTIVIPDPTAFGGGRITITRPLTEEVVHSSCQLVGRARGWGQPLTLDPTAEPMKYFWVSRKSTTIGNKNITAPAACKPTRGRPFGSR